MLIQPREYPFVRAALDGRSGHVVSNLTGCSGWARHQQEIQLGEIIFNSQLIRTKKQNCMHKRAKTKRAFHSLSLSSFL